MGMPRATGKSVSRVAVMAASQTSYPRSSGGRVLKLKNYRLLRIEALSDGVACKCPDDPDRQGRDQNRANDSRAWKKQANPCSNFNRSHHDKGALAQAYQGERLRHELHTGKLREPGR